MREILFRGKSVDNEEWIYGSFIPDLLEVYQGDKNVDGIIKPFGKTKEERLMVEVLRETVGQYTGLTDKNGNKIFEGDILIFYNGEEFSNYEVIWFGNAYKVLMEGETEIQDDLDLFFCEHSEVIGNIHDTPKL